ncbi:MAG: tRNA (adenosine(37)-N6)-threonylcarbamoyltransferase complex transferase subunit TsaD [Parcubacteria group bacterium]|jgi:N6-L-threonylcarbamoyladenine synthase
MIILGIETSCDETAAAIISANFKGISVLSNVVSSQIALHSKWGGVVPNLAAREHLKNILPVIKRALKTARVTPEKIDLIAVTAGPGLIPALLIGVNSAKTLSYSWGKPLIGIHHIEGHIYANFVGKNQKSGIKFPLLCLVVSGGHTQLVLMKKHLNYEIVGQTLDDAAGEAFDKVARILGLDYPGGPIISKTANSYKLKANNYKLAMPRPMINSKNFDFSFSGLKTAVLYETKKHPELIKNKDYVSAMCHEFQQAVIDVLISKTIRAARRYRPKTIMIAGGVSANIELRRQLGEKIDTELKNTSYVIPDMTYSVDNAAMIATAGHFRYQSQKNKKILSSNWKKLEADANLRLK